MPTFDIAGMVRELGESITIKDISRSFNDRGDATETPTEHTVNAVVEVMDGSEDDVKEGRLSIQDIIVWVSDTEANSTYLSDGNKIAYNSNTYRIINVLPYSGHYEVHAEKIA